MVTYEKNRYPKVRQDEAGNNLCRGCTKPVPPNRQTWCSNACYDRFCPSRVKIAVRNRDKGICQICQRRIVDLKAEWASAEITDWKGIADPRTWDEYQSEQAAWRKTHPYPRPEYDHIIPFSEGGLTVLENMRTLCTPCHLRRTAEWRASKRKPYEHD